jgi:hypothetical protein
MPIHDRFDLPRWIKEFNLGPLADETRRWAAAQTAPIDDPNSAPIEKDVPFAAIDGPQGIAVIEQIRAGFDVKTLGPPSPTDLFIWALGEPANRAATKIGGVPYRPAAQPWPKRKDGSPMPLLAQICFADSLDIAHTPGGLLSKPGPLPGDVLLIFAPGDYLVDWDDDDQDSIAFEWQPLGLTDLVRLEDVPPSKLTPAYAQIHRTADFNRPPDNHPIYNLYSPKALALLSGTKIGGIPSWSQDNRNLAGAHLCTIGSLNPHGEHYPLLNIPKNPEGEDYVDSNLLMLADVGQLYLFIDKRGKIHWTVQGG